MHVFYPISSFCWCRVVMSARAEWLWHTTGWATPISTIHWQDMSQFIHIEMVKIIYTAAYLIHCLSSQVSRLLLQWIAGKQRRFQHHAGVDQNKRRRLLLRKEAHQDALRQRQIPQIKKHNSTHFSYMHEPRISILNLHWKKKRRQVTNSLSKF